MRHGPKWTALLVAVVSLGCSRMLVPPRIGPAAPRVGDAATELRYQDILTRWTRRAEIYDGLDSRVFFVSTFHAMEFRLAKVERVAAFRALPEFDRNALMESERNDHATGLEVLLGVHANERRFDDFSRRDSMWRIALATDAGEALPVSIERLPRPDVSLRAVYPYLEPFWTAYRVRFPRTFPNGVRVFPEGTDRFELRLSSPVGNARMLYVVPKAYEVESVSWP